MASPWMTLEEAAMYLGKKSIRTVKRYMKDRSLTFYRPASSVMFHVDDLDKWMRAGKVESFEEYSEEILRKSSVGLG